MLYGMPPRTTSREDPPRAPGSARAWIDRGKILVASALWGTTGTSQALAPPGARPTSVAAVRLVLGGTALLLIAVGRRSLGGARMPPHLVVLAAGALVGAQLCFFQAVDRTGVAVGTLVAIGSSPVIAGGLSWGLRRERPGARWSVATMLAIGGCAVMATAGRSIAVEPLGITLALGVGLGYAVYILTTEELLRFHATDAVTAAVFSLAAVGVTPLLAASDLSWVVQPSGAAIACHLGLVTVALAYTLFSSGLRVVPGTLAVTLTLAEPVTAAVLGVALLGERLTAGGWLGALAILTGLGLLTMVRDRGPEP